MHVGFNLLFMVPGETGGTETYARELIPALVEERPDLRMTFFLNRETGRSSPWDELGECVVLPVNARRRAEWVGGEQLILPTLSRRRGCDLVHSLANTAPTHGSVPRVTTVQDLTHRAGAGAHGPIGTGVMRGLVPRVIATSARVIAPSQATVDQIVGIIGCDPGLIDLVYHGPGRRLGPAAGVDEVRLARRGRRPADRPRRRNPPAAQARPGRDRRNRPDPEAAPPAARDRGTADRAYAPAADAGPFGLISGLSGDVRFTGGVPDPVLETLYELATCLVAPSRHEGFGLPVLEAMARGIPVVCSDGGAQPEVAGDAALLYGNGHEAPRALAETLERLLGDEREQERLREAGLQRVSQFSWAATAKGTVESFEAALAAPQRQGTSGER